MGGATPNSIGGRFQAYGRSTKRPAGDYMIRLSDRTACIFPAGFVPGFIIGLDHAQRLLCVRCLA